MPQPPQPNGRACRSVPFRASFKKVHCGGLMKLGSILLNPVNRTDGSCSIGPPSTLFRAGPMGRPPVPWIKRVASCQFRDETHGPRASISLHPPFVSRRSMRFQKVRVFKNTRGGGRLRQDRPCAPASTSKGVSWQKSSIPTKVSRLKFHVKQNKGWAWQV